MTYLKIADYMSKDTRAIAAVSESSSIAEGFINPDNQTFSSGGLRTWNAYVTSNLSVRNVSFYLDGSATPIVVQEIQDVNPRFAKDQKWLYHASFDTSSLNPGRHTLTATATDVAGLRKSVTQQFMLGKSR